MQITFNNVYIAVDSKVGSLSIITRTVVMNFCGSKSTLFSYTSLILYFSIFFLYSFQFFFHFRHIIILSRLCPQLRSPQVSRAWRTRSHFYFFCTIFSTRSCFLPVRWVMKIIVWQFFFWYVFLFSERCCYVRFFNIGVLRPILLNFFI